jgi:hypothetical protein
MKRPHAMRTAVVLAVLTAGFTAVLTLNPSPANAYSYGQTNCGYDANLANADQTLRTATDAAIYMQQNLNNAYSVNVVNAVPIAYNYLARADARYKDAKAADDQIRASDEAACKNH